MCSIWVVYICVYMCSCVTLPLKCVIISWNIQSFNYLQHLQVKTDTHLLVISMFGVELLPGAHPQRGVYHVHLAGDLSLSGLQRGQVGLIHFTSPQYFKLSIFIFISAFWKLNSLFIFRIWICFMSRNILPF